MLAGFESKFKERGEISKRIPGGELIGRVYRLENARSLIVAGLRAAAAIAFHFTIAP
jgi:hypothetical protein